EYLPQITPWLMRFWRAGWPDRVAASLKAQSAMMRVARTEAESMIAAARLDHLIRRDGVLELYESEAELRGTAKDDAAKAAEGIEFRHVRGDELAELQPGLSPRIVCGTYIPKWQTVSDPYDYAIAVSKAAIERGASFRKGEVVQLRPHDDGVIIEFSDGSAQRAKQAVVAGGAWSKRLTDPLGDDIPLETERGYNTTLPGYSFDVRRQLVFAGHGFVVTPLESGIRVGGAVELGGLNLPPNFARADAMLQKAARFMPGLVTTGGKQWMGFRPSLPDSLPAIGYSRRSQDIVYAFGHGHLGLTQSAGTGKLVANLLAHLPQPIDLTPFSPQRF
ncbi:MAG TPA: FAD-binding oxidoreductase, partial [Devosia sp.]|nr:FAD-binding oxidoreductase [Devosia sp.]